MPTTSMSMENTSASKPPAHLPLPWVLRDKLGINGINGLKYGCGTNRAKHVLASSMALTRSNALAAAAPRGEVGKPSSAQRKKWPELALVAPGKKPPGVNRAAFCQGCD